MKPSETAPATLAELQAELAALPALQQQAMQRGDGAGALAHKHRADDLAILIDGARIDAAHRRVYQAEAALADAKLQSAAALAAIPETPAAAGAALATARAEWATLEADLLERQKVAHNREWSARNLVTTPAAAVRAAREARDALLAELAPAPPPPPVRDPRAEYWEDLRRRRTPTSVAPAAGHVEQIGHTFTEVPPPPPWRDPPRSSK